MILYDPKTREAWLKLRLNGIGGSDAGTVLGLNKYKTNIELWEEKTGRAKSEFTGNEATRYGHDAEEHIRALFHLDHPDLNLDYHEFRMHGNEKYPFMYATLDGELTGYGKKGILEIKTATIQNNGQWSEWENRIPDTYYAQVVHQLTVTVGLCLRQSISPVLYTRRAQSDGQRLLYRSQRCRTRCRSTYKSRNRVLGLRDNRQRTGTHTSGNIKQKGILKWNF